MYWDMTDLCMKFMRSKPTRRRRRIQLLHDLQMMVAMLHSNWQLRTRKRERMSKTCCMTTAVWCYYYYYSSLYKYSELTDEQTDRHSNPSSVPDSKRHIYSQQASVPLQCMSCTAMFKQLWQADMHWNYYNLKEEFQLVFLIISDDLDVFSITPGANSKTPVGACGEQGRRVGPVGTEGPGTPPQLHNGTCNTNKLYHAMVG